MSVQKPAGYEDVLGDYGVVWSDSNCGEPIAWGWPIVATMDTARFEALKKTPGLELWCVKKGSWVCVRARLSAADARAKYGARVSVATGPRGGFESVSFIDDATGRVTKFTSRYMDPRRPA